MIQQKSIDEILKNAKDNRILSTRRNKSHNATNYAPRNYIDRFSINYDKILGILDYVNSGNFALTDVLSAYAAKLMDQADIPKEVSNLLITKLNGGNKAPASDECLNLCEAFPLSLVPKEDTLGMLYISLRRMQDKKSTGSYYTPCKVADLLIQEVFSKKLDDSYSHEFSSNDSCDICDPSCGTGNFLIRLPDFVPLQCIHGIDIDEMAVAIARINLAIRFMIKSLDEAQVIINNIKSENFLTSSQSPNYHIMIGNPPWGSSFSKEELNNLKGMYECFPKSGNPESFSLFLEKSLSCRKVAFLLPETILGSDTHQNIRSIILKNSNIEGISYLGDVFYKVQCPSVILRLNKNSFENIESCFYTKTSNNSLKNKTQYVPKKSFSVPQNRISINSFNILADNEEYKIIEKMLSCPHFTLKGQADFALGIVTGNNNKLIRRTKSHGHEAIVRGSDVDKYGISQVSSYVLNDDSSFQQMAPIEYYRAPEKLIYRFISPVPCFALDTEGLLTLNSANIMIPRVSGYSAAYIMAVLNSKAMEFYYTHTFRNFKMLRSAIESLPIPECSGEEMEEITDISLKIHEEICKGKKADENLVKILDKKVANLYNLCYCYP